MCNFVSETLISATVLVTLFCESTYYSKDEADRLSVHNDTKKYLLSQAYDKDKNATYNYVNGVKKNHAPVVDNDNLI